MSPRQSSSSKNKSPDHVNSTDDANDYAFGHPSEGTFKIDSLSESERRLVSEVGFDPSLSKVASSFIQFDADSAIEEVIPRPPGLEVMSIRSALQKYDWLSGYIWKAVRPDADRYTSLSSNNEFNGYFIRALPNAKIEMPVQSCLVIKRHRFAQNVHNIVIAEEGSELHVITGCTTPHSIENSLHLGISEFYVKSGAKLTFTMVHRWSDAVDVRPRSGTVVERDGTFISNYALLSSVRSIQTAPSVLLAEPNAKAELNSIVYGAGKSEYDVGGTVILEAPGTGGRVISRTIATDSSSIVTRGRLVGRASSARARLECNGLLLSNSAKIVAVPELEATVEGVELSHEATVGRVGADQLNYLMSRGLTEDEATSLIVRGFIRVRSPELPASLQRTIDDAIRMTFEKAL